MCRKIALAVLLICTSGLIWAEKADLTMPINMDAGSCTARMDKSGVRRCSGGVTITQGSMILKCETVEMRQDADDNILAQCEGKPVTFRQKLDTGEWAEAEALRVTYDSKKSFLELRGKASVKRGEGKDQEVVAAEVLTYDMANEVYESSGKGEGRTHIQIQPKKKQAVQ